MTPSAVSRSKVAVEVRPTSLATGTPLSVMTTSLPVRARSSHSLRWARNSVTATSMNQLYTRITAQMYSSRLIGDCSQTERYSATSITISTGDRSPAEVG